MSLDTEIQAKAREAHAGVAATEARMMGRPRTVEEITEALDSFDLGRWRLAWDAHLRGVPAPVPPVPMADPPRPDEVCPDEVAADAAVGVAPLALAVYDDPRGDA